MDYGISWKGYRRIFLIVITIICLIAIYYFRNLSFTKYNQKPIYINEKDFWNVNDLYGGWKVTRVICTAKGGYGDLPLGNDIGRYIYISEKTVTDSKQHEEAAAEGKVCYNMKILKSEKNEYSMSENEMIGEFQRYSSIILEKAGITDQVIYEFIFYADKDSEDDLFYANNLRLFSYRQNDKNMLVMNFEVI